MTEEISCGKFFDEVHGSDIAIIVYFLLHLGLILEETVVLENEDIESDLEYFFINVDDLVLPLDDARVVAQRNKGGDDDVVDDDSSIIEKSNIVIMFHAHAPHLDEMDVLHFIHLFLRQGELLHILSVLVPQQLGHVGHLSDHLVHAVYLIDETPTAFERTQLVLHAHAVRVEGLATLDALDRALVE